MPEVRAEIFLLVEPGRDGQRPHSHTSAEVDAPAKKKKKSSSPRAAGWQTTGHRAGASSRAASLINTAAFPVHLLQVPSLIITVWQERQCSGKSPE